jgi:hypothetical protein
MPAACCPRALAAGAEAAAKIIARKQLLLRSRVLPGLGS